MKININDFINEYCASFPAVDPALPSDLIPIVKSFLERFEPLNETPVASIQGRWQDRQIASVIPNRAKVLDLGCGDGKLLSFLMREKQIFGQGVELKSEKVFKAIENGIPVFQANIETDLIMFRDRGFDYVILEETLQTLQNPLSLLGEMLRIGRRGIVTFPNFGYWKVRLDLLLRGKMPVSDALPYRWHDTPNIHLFTYDDFRQLLESHACYIEVGYALVNGEIGEINENSNLEAEELLLVVRKQ